MNNDHDSGTGGNRTMMRSKQEASIKTYLKEGDLTYTSKEAEKGAKNIW